MRPYIQRLVVFAAISSFSGLTSNCSTAQELATENNDRPAQLVEQLGAAKWADRTAAIRQLMKGGDDLTQAIQVGIAHSDPEIRRSCRRLLVQRLKNDLTVAITFLKADDYKNPVEHDLPCWTRYRKEIGIDRDARKLFVAMLSEEPALMFALEAGGKVASNAANARLRQVISSLYSRISTQRIQPKLGTIAALIFAVSHPDVDDKDGVMVGRWLSNVLRQPAFTSTLTSKPPSAASRKLIGLWIDAKSDEAGDRDRLNIAVTYQVMPAGLKLALQILAEGKTGNASITAQAFEGVARLGGRSYARLLAKFLDDKRSMGVRIVNKKRIQMHVRDAALAWLIYTTKQDPGQYNLPNAKRWFDMLKKSPNRVVSTSYFYFSSEKAREEAHRKWAAWEKAHPLPDLPADAIVKPRDRLATPANPNGKQPDENVEPVEGPSVMPFADRGKLNRLLRARQMLETNPNRIEAISIIGRLLMDERDWIFRTDAETPVYRTLRSAAEELIGRLTPQQLEFYEQQFGKLARVDLDNAVDGDHSIDLKRVAEKYYFTKAGGEAVYHIAMKQIDQRQFFHAALWLSRLKRSHPNAKQLEPRLSLVLAFCWHESGVPERAADVLMELGAAGYQEASLFDKKLSLPPRGSSREFLESMFADHTAGNSSHVGRRLPVKPITDRPAKRSRFENNYDTSIKHAFKLIDDLHRQFGVAAIPHFQPIVVDDTVIFRSLTELTCVSLVTHQVIWKANVLNGMETLQSASAKSASVTLARAVQQWFWDRSVASSLVGDGQRVFAIEDVSPAEGGIRPVMEVLGDGTPTLREGSGKKHNRLTAWDAKTGKVLWECGGPVGIRVARQAVEDEKPSETADARSLAGIRFIGAPFPLGDQLCVVGHVEDQIELFLLESATGQMVSRSTLHVIDDTIPNRFMMGFPFGNMKSSRLNSIASAPVLNSDAMFVYVGSNRYVAFDLTTRRILWAYEEKRHDQPGAPNIRNINLGQQFAAKQMTKPDRWTRATPVIDGDYVLVTPPVTDLLVCLNRDTGKVVWDIPREDGLFVAGIQDGAAIVVGRNSIKAIRVADGKPVWKPTAVPFPQGVQPAGHGILIPALRSQAGLTAPQLHIPQANGDVAVINIATGRWETAMWKVNGPAGNLTLSSKAIVSQDAMGITIFERIEDRREQIAATLKANPQDLRALLIASELARDDKKYDQAIEFAIRAVNAGGKEPALENLSRCLKTSIVAVNENPELVRKATETAIATAEKYLPRDTQTDVLRVVANSQKTSGGPLLAFETWLQVIERLPAEASDLQKRSFGWLVRDDRLIQAELHDLFEAATDGVREVMTAQLLKLRAERSPEFYLRFAGFHESSHASRIRLAEQRTAEKKFLEAEQLLLSVSKRGSVTEQLAATQLLVELIAQKDQIAASRYVQQLAGRLGTATNPNGDTGRTIAAALAKKFSGSPHTDWPTGPIEVRDIKNTNTTSNTYPLLLEYRDEDQGLTVKIDSSLTKLFAYDALGRTKWNVVLGNPKTSAIRYLRYAVRYNQSRCVSQGQLTVSWIGDQVCAIDGFGKSGKPTWSMDCTVANPLDPYSTQYRPQIRPKTFEFQDAQKLPLVVTSSFVCFQQGRKLVAVDPVDGQMLWWRDDLPTGCDLFGDRGLVFARIPDKEIAFVFRGLDGKKLGTRPAPIVENRILSRGRVVVSSQVEGPNLTVMAQDLWAKKVVWKQTVPKASRLDVVNAHQLAILKPDGQFDVIDFTKGKTVVSSKIEMAKQNEGLIVMRKADRFVAIVNEPQKVKNVVQILQSATPGNRKVHGQVYVIDSRGKLVSNHRIDDQAIKTNQPQELPLVVFFRRYQERKKNPNGSYSTTRPKTKLTLLDVRSGKTVHQFDREFGTDIDYRYLIDPVKKHFDILTRTIGLRVTFTPSK